MSDGASKNEKLDELVRLMKEPLPVDLPAGFEESMSALASIIDQAAKSLVGLRFPGAHVSRGLFDLAEAADGFRESGLRFAEASETMREVLAGEPVKGGNLAALARLVDYLSLARDDPLVRQSAAIAEIVDVLIECVSDTPLRNPTWEAAFAAIIDEGSRAQSARHNRRRKKVQPREAFKKWLEENPQTVVVHIDELRSLPGSGLPPAVFEYVMKSTNRALREAYNEVRPGTLRPGR